MEQTSAARSLRSQPAIVRQEDAAIPPEMRISLGSVSRRIQELVEWYRGAAQTAVEGGSGLECHEIAYQFPSQACTAAFVQQLASEFGAPVEIEDAFRLGEEDQPRDPRETRTILYRGSVVIDLWNTGILVYYPYAILTPQEKQQRAASPKDLHGWIKEAIDSM